MTLNEEMRAELLTIARLCLSYILLYLESLLSIEHIIDFSVAVCSFYRFMK